MEPENKKVQKAKNNENQFSSVQKVSVQGNSNKNSQRNT